jgi:hypothetical protein
MRLAWFSVGRSHRTMGELTACGDTPLGGCAPPNMRLKLAGCGGRLKGKDSVLIAAATPRSLSAIR